VPQSGLADDIDLIYAAALGEGATWPEVGSRLCTLTRARRASLVIPSGEGAGYDLFLTPDDNDALHDYYRDLSPWRTEAAKVIHQGMPTAGLVVRGEDFVPDAVFLNSEFYRDYARQRGIRHMVGGVLDSGMVTPIGFTRDAAAGPFEDDERRALRTLLPHLQRALQLRSRLGTESSRLGTGALDALSIAVIVVDAGMRVRHANSAAVTLTGSVCGIALQACAPGPDIGNITLTARHPDDHARLAQVVAAVAKGGAGRAFRLRNTRDEPASHASLAVLVSPALTHLLSGSGCRVQPGTAMIVARHLTNPSLPPPGLMCDLYGLTKTEAAVALSFGGGATAEDVARSRRVSPETIRSQVKAILRKTNTSNLRDLERIIAISSAMLPTSS
jgi:DNA-binding NarL/FixJ family response regulator